MAYVLKIQSKKYLLVELNVEVGNGVNNDSGKPGVLLVGVFFCWLVFLTLKLLAIPMFQEVIYTSVYELRSFSRQNGLLHGF